ncbi:gamma-glutamylcyclotransferase family protein [Lichenifustis flavocetrariae]|uniref:Gamma-glutamylcyclotransferase n=1 Tax=Lichenifustis flavocetrariae TaxID=2949735 RepID=A0AA41YUC5_9HYPH|nr:gamma-glutamylcyclotransferase [Lichenifustis flavocetrariae]MCW6507192.1 gamma-glutamylcyclotransferase [Lichenifustis flavocetrariae]
MPAYFAYGANLDRIGMAQRCPGSHVVAPARLADYRFFIMVDGYASLRPEQGAVVHGLLWQLAPDDLAALDAYEEIGAGLYRRLTLSVMHDAGVADAIVYVGRSRETGESRPGYMENVLAAATLGGLPEAYLRELRGWLPATSRPSAAMA